MKKSIKKFLYAVVLLAIGAGITAYFTRHADRSAEARKYYHEFIEGYSQISVVARMSNTEWGRLNTIIGHLEAAEASDVAQKVREYKEQVETVRHSIGSSEKENRKVFYDALREVKKAM